MTKHIREMVSVVGHRECQPARRPQGDPLDNGPRARRARRCRLRPALAEDAPKWGADGMPHGTVNNPLAFVSIAPDGTVTIVCHRSEMGQGVRTGMPLIVADEMEADWARVKVAQATGDEVKYGNQDTDGSRSTRHFFMPMRQVGAAARMMLEAAAAKRWGVPRLRRGGEEPRGHSEVDRARSSAMENSPPTPARWACRRMSAWKSRAPRRRSACHSRTLPSSATSARKGPTSSTASTSRPAAPLMARTSVCPGRNTPSLRARRSWAARSPPTTRRTRKRSRASSRSSRFPRRRYPMKFQPSAESRSSPTTPGLRSRAARR